MQQASDKDRAHSQPVNEDQKFENLDSADGPDCKLAKSGASPEAKADNQSNDETAFQPVNEMNELCVIIDDP